MGEFDGVRIELPGVDLFDKNIESIFSAITTHWKGTSTKNLKWQIVSQLPLLKNLVKIGSGVFDLFYLPLSYYKQGNSVIDGTLAGVKNFVKHTTAESYNISSSIFSSIGSLIYFNAKSASKALTSAKKYL